MMQHNKMTGTPIATPVRERFEDRMRRIAAKNLKEATMSVIENHPHLARWYCLQVEPRHELSVENILKEAGVEVFLARQKVMIVRRGQKLEQEISMFPGYLMVRCVPSDRAFEGLRRQKFVVRIMGGVTGVPLPIRDEVINLFKKIANENVPFIATDKSFIEGDRAEIKDSAFAGFTCLILQVKWCKQAKARVAINVDGQVFEIESMPLAFLKKL
jgi:transcriptional antiterminator NusG